MILDNPFNFIAEISFGSFLFLVIRLYKSVHISFKYASKEAKSSTKYLLVKDIKLIFSFSLSDIYLIII